MYIIFFLNLFLLIIDRVLFINFIIILLHGTVLLYYNYYKMINLFPYELNFV